MKSNREMINSDLELEQDAISRDNRSMLRKITDVYFKPKSFEKSGKLYRALGVKYVQKAVMGTVGKVFRTMGVGEIAGQYFIGKTRNLRSLKTYDKGTRFNETIHAPQILWNATELAQAISEDNYGSAVFWGGLLLINAPCTMLQRYNRARVEKAIERIESRI